MQKTMTTLFILFVGLSLILSACAPQATSTPAEANPPAAAPTQAEVVEPVSEAEDTGVAATGMLSEIDPGEVTGGIITAGSSTVFPLSEAVVDLFESEGYSGQITIDEIGSGAGFERFCKTGETDIANASRAIKESEIESCRAIGREPIEFRVGTDALAVVVSQQNDFLTNVTLAELALIFSSEATNWSDVNPDWPDQPIKRYSPGTDSGTYDFFIEAVMETAYEGDQAVTVLQSAANLQQSENDNVLVQGVQSDPYAIGYFGYAYYQENTGTLKILNIEGVEPTFETVESGDYLLARPLFIYSDATIIQQKPQVGQFISFYLQRVNEIIEEVGYFPASEAALTKAEQNLLAAAP